MLLCVPTWYRRPSGKNTVRYLSYDALDMLASTTTVGSRTYEGSQVTRTQTPPKEPFI